MSLPISVTIGGKYFYTLTDPVVESSGCPVFKLVKLYSDSDVRPEGLATVDSDTFGLSNPPGSGETQVRCKVANHVGCTKVRVCIMLTRNRFLDQFVNKGIDSIGLRTDIHIRR